MAVANFTAYFDASGNVDHRFMTMTGFVGRVEQWERFDSEWNSLLAEFNPKATHFHMTDFMTSHKGWEFLSGNTSERDRICQLFMGVIIKNTNKGFCHAVNVVDYNAVNRRYLVREHLGHPYMLCGAICLGHLQQWSRGKGRPSFEDILCVVEDGDQGKGEFINWARSQGFNAIPQAKRHIRQFDACDLAAWKSRIALDRCIGLKRHVTPDKSAIDDVGLKDIAMHAADLGKLVRDRGKSATLFSERQLLNWCREKNVSLR